MWQYDNPSYAICQSCFWLSADNEDCMGATTGDLPEQSTFRNPFQRQYTCVA